MLRILVVCLVTTFLPRSAVANEMHLRLAGGPAWLQGGWNGERVSRMQGLNGRSQLDLAARWGAVAFGTEVALMGNLWQRVSAEGESYPLRPNMTFGPGLFFALIGQRERHPFWTTNLGGLLPYQLVGREHHAQVGKFLGFEWGNVLGVELPSGRGWSTGVGARIGGQFLYGVEDGGLDYDPSVSLLSVGILLTFSWTEPK